MMKMLRFLLAAFLAFAPVAANAQSSPGLYTGQVPTAAQWNSYFAAKLDYSSTTANRILNALQKGNNLSDVTNPAVALANIGGIGPATTDTLTNKTISGANNTITQIAGGSTTQLQYSNGGNLAGITGATSNGTTVTLTSPTLVTPALGTPASGNMANVTNIPAPQLAGQVLTSAGGLGADNSAATGIPVFAAGTATVTAATGTGAPVRATSPTLVTPALGVPTALDCTNCTNVPTSGITGTLATSKGGLGADNSAATGIPVFAAGTATVTAATGSGAPVRATSPTLVTPALGTPTALVATNATGTAASLTAGAATNVAGGVAGAVHYQSGVGATGFTAAGSSGQILRSAGTGAPTWSTATYPATAGTNGNFLVSDGTNWASTSVSAATQTTGTWTPTYVGSTSGSGDSYTQQHGTYIKTGKQVHIEFYVRGNPGTMAGFVQVGNFPFTSATSNAQATCAIGATQGFTYPTGTVPGFTVNSNATNATMNTFGSAVGYSNQTVAGMASAAIMQASCDYTTP